MSDTTSNRPVRRTSVDAAAVAQQDRQVVAYNEAYDKASGTFTAILGINGLHHTAELNLLSQLNGLLATFEAAALTPEGQRRLFVNNPLLGALNGSDSLRDQIDEIAELWDVSPAWLVQLFSNVFEPLAYKSKEMRAEIVTAIQRLVNGKLGDIHSGGRLDIEVRNESLQSQLRNALNAPALPAPQVDTSRISELESQLAQARAEAEQLRQQSGTMYTQAQLDAAVQAAHQAGQRDKDTAVRQAVADAIATERANQPAPVDLDAVRRSAVNDAVRKGEVIRKDDHDTVVRDSVRAARQDIDDQIHSAVATVYRQIASNVVPKDRRKGFFLNDDDVIITTGDDATPESKVLLKVINDPSADIPRPASSPASTSTQSGSDNRPKPGPHNGGQSGNQSGRAGNRRASAPAGSPGSHR